MVVWKQDSFTSVIWICNSRNYVQEGIYGVPFSPLPQWSDPVPFTHPDGSRVRRGLTEHTDVPWNKGYRNSSPEDDIPFELVPDLPPLQSKKWVKGFCNKTRLFRVSKPLCVSGKQDTSP